MRAVLSCDPVANLAPSLDHFMQKIFPVCPENGTDDDFLKEANCPFVLSEGTFEYEFHGGKTGKVAIGINYKAERPVTLRSAVFRLTEVGGHGVTCCKDEQHGGQPDFMTEGNDHEAMKLAIEQSKLCKPSEGAYSVGACLYSSSGTLLSTGYSRELPGNTHAEQCCFMKLKEDCQGGTMYTTMEPCTIRLSGQVGCTQRIIDYGVARVVFGVKEPPNFVDCQGIGILQQSGVKVVHLDEYTDECLAVNTHLVK
jgi:pyrimidine deaminase RibD-like protein